MKKSVAIIGGGTSGLFFAAFLDIDIFNVTIYEKKNSVGRKFLVAGKGGFNLTHSLDKVEMYEKYSPKGFMKPALDKFDNVDFRKWLSNIGIDTFIGSSGRVFPLTDIKPIEVLKAIKFQLENKGVKIVFNETFVGWADNKDLILENSKLIKADIKVFAMGGGSWSITGSDGTWLDIFDKDRIQFEPFRAANCAFNVDWTESILSKHEGSPLKNVKVSISKHSQLGELVLTRIWS